MDLRDVRRAVPPLDAVLAHSLLGTVTAAKAAIQLAVTAEVERSTRDRLLNIATDRLDFVAQQLHLASGGFLAEAVGLALENDQLALPDQ